MNLVDGQNRKQDTPITTVCATPAPAIDSGEEDFAGGEPVCWLDLLDEEGRMPDRRPSQRRQPFDEEPLGAAED